MAPTTLTRQQFVQTAAAKNPGASYAKYLSFIAKRRGASPTMTMGDNGSIFEQVPGKTPYLVKKGAAQNAPAGATAPDPLEPLTQAEQDAIVRRTVGTMPTVTTPQQQQTQAQGLLDPVVQRITAAINAQAKSGTQAVQGYTNQLASIFGNAGQGVTNAFAPAEAATAAANSALADRVTGIGNQNSDALASRLASINAPDAVDPAVAALRQAAVGAGNASYATGDASLEQMLAQHGNASAYAAKLPDIARLSGVQQVANVQGQAGKDLADQLSPIYAQIPSLVQNIRNADQQAQQDYSSKKVSLIQTLLGENSTRAIARAGFAGTATKASLPDATLSAKLGYLVDSTGAAIPNAKGETQILPGFKWNASGTATVKTTTPKTKTAPKVSTALSASNGYLTDTSGSPILRGGSTVPYKPYVPPKPPKSNKPSASLFKQANSEADTFYNGVPAHQRWDSGSQKYVAVPGTGSDYTPYPQALKKLIALSPSDPTWPKVATSILNSRYKEGEGGRPLTKKTQAKQNAQGKAFASSFFTGGP